MTGGARETAVLAAVLVALLLVGYAAHRYAGVRYEERLSASLGRVAPPNRGATLDAALARLPVLRGIARRLAEAELTIRLAHVLLGWLVLAYPANALLSRMYGRQLGLVLTVVALPGATILVLGQLVARRRRLYARQTLDLVRHLAGSARAGLSVGHAFTTAADELGAPLAPQLRRVALDMEFGKLPVTALEELRDRSGLAEMDLLVDAIVIQQRSGGDLVSLLMRLAGGMEAIARGRTEAAGLVANVKATPWTVLGLSLATVFLVNQMSDGILDRLYQWPVLLVVFYVSLAILVAIVPIIRRITRLEPGS